MGLFGGSKTCCECGKKAGLLSRVSLKDGGYLCDDCRSKLSDQLDDAFKAMTKEDYERNIEVAKENDRKYREEFRETFAVYLRDNKCFSADETHGWWVNPKYERPVLLQFDQIQRWNVDLRTEYDFDDDKDDSLLGEIMKDAMQARYYESLRQNHPELPVCPPNCKIMGMDLHIYVNHPMIHDVVIDCFDIGLFTMEEDDMQSAYGTVIQIIEFLQKVKDGAQASASGTESDIAAQLRKYKQLLDEGVITQQEFKAKKKQVLGL